MPDVVVLVDSEPTGDGYAHNPGVLAMDGQFVITFMDLPPVLAFLSVTLDAGTVFVNFRTAALDEEGSI